MKSPPSGRGLLIVSPNFPPVNAPDMQRVRMALRHYVEAGCQVTVLAAAPDEASQAIEPELAATLPPEVEVIRLRTLPVRHTRRMGLSTLGWRILPALWREGSRQLATGKFAAVFFSTTQFNTMPLGRVWLARFGVPYFVDLQDPWLSDFYDRPGAPPPPGGWKYRIARALAWLLEGWTLRKTAGVMSVSPGYLETLRTRYAWFGGRRSEVIPFGVSLDDFATAPALVTAPGGRTIVYTGRLGPDMTAQLEVVFKAVAQREAPELCLAFWGTSYADKDRQVSIAAEVAARCGVADRVREHPGRIAYLETIQRLRQADAILLLGSDDLDYSPSKVYPVLASDRPVLAVVRAGSVLATVLTNEGFTDFVTIGGPVDPVRQMVTVLERWAADPGSFRLGPVERERFLARFEAGRVAARHLQMFFGDAA